MNESSTAVVDGVSMERFLDHLIDPLECIDTYGRTYIDDLEHIAKENHDYDPGTRKFPDPRVQEYFGKLCRKYKINSVGEIADFARNNCSALLLADYRPRTSFYDLLDFPAERPQAYQEFLEGEKADPVAANNELQIAWSERGVISMPDLSNNADLYELYLSSDRFSPWTYLIRREIASGKLKKEEKAVCIGPRWAGEILYFRNNIGLSNAIGVDLLPSRPELIMAADMHKLPFEGNSVALVFCRSTIDKSYDSRLLAQEIRRVLKPDGYVIVESIGPNPHGVNPVGRTDVKTSANLLKLFKGVTGRVIYQRDQPPSKSQSKVKNIIQMFIQLNKAGQREPSGLEPFPVVKHAFYWKARYLLLRIRIKLGRLFRFG